ncbi:hypothetical protein OF83DRAFT_1057256 [Amylostereum chailletii]|nr:hypothetical protein OF83DRAFT_1057256 [Amylostereum chailletii]
MIRRISVFGRKASTLPSDSGSSAADSLKDIIITVDGSSATGCGPSSSPSNLSHFLDLQKVNYLRAVEQRQARQWTIVMGNEAGDLDSVASSLAYAWYATHHLRQLTIPLLLTPRADFALRAENIHALTRAGVDLATLLTTEEMPAPSGEKFALVDHNKLLPRFASTTTPNESPAASPRLHASSAPASPRVVAIVDHHADEKDHLDASPRIIEAAGSCSSLVARLFSSLPSPSPPSMAPSFQSPSSSGGLPHELALLLLSAIVIDTGGLKEGGKALQVDHDAANWLLPRSGLPPPSLVPPPSATRAMFSISATSLVDNPAPARVQDMREIRDLDAELQGKKNDVGHLGTRDLLRRDYKEYAWKPIWDLGKTVQAGLATVPRGIKPWLEEAKEGFWEYSVAFMDERKLDVFGVLTTWRDEPRLGSSKGKHRREQAWVVRADDEVRRRLWAGLEGSKALKLKRKEGKRYTWTKEGYEVRVYDQGNADATRKVTAPLVKEIFEDSETQSVF